VNENIKPYGVTTHRHTPEIEEQLSYAAGMKYHAGEGVRINFTPHLVPMNRGILATCYATLNRWANAKMIQDAYKEFYQKELFIRLLGKDTFPETRWVEGSNFVDIGFTVDERTGLVIVASALDNLVKGAAGQAVQNMNILFGLEETMGLSLVPVFP
jgi:N-acetyl-gamma-glutamyl-phosphate reductase